MSQEVSFPRNIDNVLASINEHGLYVISGWTMAIPKNDIIQYVKNQNSNPNAGFYEHDGSIVLSHRDGKIIFSHQEADAIIELVNEAYGPL